MRIALFLLLSFFCLLSCSRSEVPRNILPPEKMMLIIFDLLRAGELVNTRTVGDSLYNRDAESKKMYEQVFLIHMIKRSEFYNSYKYYQAHPDVNKVLFDSLTAYGNKKLIVAGTTRNNN